MRRILTAALFLAPAARAQPVSAGFNFPLVNCEARSIAARSPDELRTAVAACTLVLALPEHDSGTQAIALTMRGWSESALGDDSAAIEDFTTALASRPATAFALDGRGIAYLNNGQAKLAAADFTQALALDPADAVAAKDRAAALAGN